MPRAKTLTMTQFIDTRDTTSVRAVEAAGYKRVPKTEAVRAEIRGAIMREGAKHGMVNGSDMTSIQRFMTETFPPLFEAIEKYTKTIRIGPGQAMNVENNAPMHAEEHFITEEELRKIQGEIKKAVPQLTETQAEVVARQVVAVPGDIDTDIESLMAGLSGLRMGGGRRMFSRILSSLKRRKSIKRKMTKRKKISKKKKATRRR